MKTTSIIAIIFAIVMAIFFFLKGEPDIASCWIGLAIFLCVSYIAHEIEVMSSGIFKIYKNQHKEAHKKLDQQEFYDIMQAYRIADIKDQDKVTKRYSDVIKWIIKNYS